MTQNSTPKYLSKRREKNEQQQQNYVCTKICTWLSIAASFTTRNGKKKKCLKTSEWKNKMQYTHVMEHCLAIKMNELLVHWDESQKIIVSKRSPHTRVHTVWVYVCGILERVKTINVRKQNGFQRLRVKGTDHNRTQGSSAV